MRKAKQLLWFIIPSVLIWIIIAIPVISVKNHTPFITAAGYFRLFIKDSTFKKALFNTLSKPILITLLISIALYAAKRIVGKRLIPKYANAVFYTLIIFLLTVSRYVLLSLFVYPYYSVSAILYTNSSSIVSTLVFMLSLQIAILFCFIFWCVDLIFDKIGKPKCDENAL